MAKKSTRKNKTIFQISREAAELTIESAAELTNISDSTISRIEAGEKNPSPDEIHAMALAYSDPALCNAYCSTQCEIGQGRVPEVKEQSLAEITLGLLATMNSLNSQRDCLINITADGKIEESEFKDFLKIHMELEEMSKTIESLQVWLEKMALKGDLDPKLIEQIKAKE